VVVDTGTVDDIIVIGVCLAACACDLRSRRIPNILTMTAALAGLTFRAALGGLPGAGSSLAGCLVGGALFFPLFALGGLGAGDVKLVAAVGAWLGPLDAMWACLFAAMAGGAMALVVALVRGYAADMLRNVWFLGTFWRTQGVHPVPGLTLKEARGPRLAYALPITLGVILALWFQ
jgi:prepilin peptidase CpaA